MMCKIVLVFACLAFAYETRGVHNSMARIYGGSREVHLMHVLRRCCSAGEKHSGLRAFAHLSTKASKALAGLLMAPCNPIAGWQITGQSCQRVLNSPRECVRSRASIPLGLSLSSTGSAKIPGGSLKWQCSRDFSSSSKAVSQLGELPVFRKFLQKQDEAMSLFIEGLLSTVPKDDLVDAPDNSQGQNPLLDTVAHVEEEVESFFLPGIGRNVSIKVAQKNDRIAGENSDVTGFILWPAGQLLLETLSKQDLSGKHVLELGSGTGIGALGAAAAGAVVTATDGADSVLQQIEENFRLNDLKVRTGRLFWGDSGDIAAMSGEYDLIVGSDILYGTPHVMKILVETLAAMSTPGRTEVMMTFAWRLHIHPDGEAKQVFQYFSECAEQYFELVSKEEPEPNLYVARWLRRES